MSKYSTVIERLERIKPGERVQFYRGDFAADLERSTDVPPYFDILQHLRLTAAKLVAAGRITVETTHEALPVEQKNGRIIKVRVTRYTAIGVWRDLARPGQAAWQRKARI